MKFLSMKCLNAIFSGTLRYDFILNLDQFIDSRIQIRFEENLQNKAKKIEAIFEEIDSNLSGIKDELSNQSVPRQSKKNTN